MKYYNRILADKLVLSFKENRIIIIIGSRQVGKTTLMEIYRKQIPQSYRQIFFNLEDVSMLNICQNIDTLKSYFTQNGINLESNKVFLIIDEFQYIKNATKLFKILYDNYPLLKILVSGSSSIEIQKHLKESLAGRKKVYKLYTLSFDEFIEFNNQSDYIKYSKLKIEKDSDKITGFFNNSYLKEYLIYGGYPKIPILKNKISKIEELQDIYNSYIQKDIKSLIKGENINEYNNLIKILASQIGNLVNINELSGKLGVSRREIINYLTILQETFIIKLINPFHSNKRAELIKMPKIYFLDTGIINYSTSNFGEIFTRNNIGSIIENFVFNEILKYKPVYYNIHFWRTKLGTEIDFILSGNDELIPIEVKWQNFDKPTIPKNILSFISTHNNVKNAVILTKEFTYKLKLNNTNIHFIPAILTSKYIKKIG